MSNQLAPSAQNASVVRESALAAMASRLTVEPKVLFTTLKNTVFKGATDDELAALVIVSNTYDLNPLLKEIYAFPKKGGGIVPMVPIDGWIKVANRQENFNGMEIDIFGDGDKPTHGTCRIHIKGRDYPVQITEYFKECYRNTEPWNTMPRRMLRNKTISQAIRVAFGVSGIFDEDEGNDAAIRDVTPAARPEARPVIDPFERTGSEPAKPETEAAPEPAAQPDTLI